MRNDSMTNHLMQDDSKSSITQMDENIIEGVFPEVGSLGDSIHFNDVNWFNEWVNGVWVSGVRLD